MLSNDDLVSGSVPITDGSSTLVIAASGVGFKTYITDLHILNTSASVVTVDIRDGVAGTVKWTVIVPAGGGIVHAFSKPLGGFTANTGVYADPSAAASTITVNLNGFKARV